MDTRHAKNKDYRRVLEEIQKEGKCPFCLVNFVRHHRNPVLREGASWVVTKNDYPYEGLILHLLFVYKSHALKISKVKAGAWDELIDHVSWAESEFNIKGGALAIRFGDTAYTGATVKHLHFHLIVPKKGKVVNFPIG